MTAGTVRLHSQAVERPYTGHRLGNRISRASHFLKILYPPSRVCSAYYMVIDETSKSKTCHFLIHFKAPMEAAITSTIGRDDYRNV